jgi:hypothetical protein
MNLNDAQKKPVLTADGVKWVQNCLYCNKQVNFLKDPKPSWISVGDYVRHKKCYPPPIK